ncbi:MAG: DUF1287 domain-containing protein [Campylobacterota bacterium]|nr:DUF1287 domain-containing protein [Campylobacterota bacterium]
MKLQVKKYLSMLLLLSSLLLAKDYQIFVKSAQSQIGKTMTYNPQYAKIKYPMGDIPISKGVCTDVVVRAFRGVDIDLQERIYRDKKSNPKRYKGLYYTEKLDPNIDHRRVKNIQAYLASRKYRVKDDFIAGDIVVWKLPSNPKELDHIGICSTKLNKNGKPLIIHNIGKGAKEEDVLEKYRIVDHFRVFKDR